MALTAAAMTSVKTSVTPVLTASTLAKPACIPSASLANARKLCEARLVAGAYQEAVAGAALALGADDPYAAQIQAAPCDWMKLPACAAPAEPPPPPMRAASKGTSIMTKTAEAPPPTVAVLAPAVPAAPPPKSNTMLIVGGLALAAVAGGAILYATRKH